MVAVEVGGPKRSTSLRLGAAIDIDDVASLPGFEFETTRRLVWDSSRDDVVVRMERRLGALELGVTTERPVAGPDVVDLLVERVRQSRLLALNWTDMARQLQGRVQFVRGRRGDVGWPDVADEALLSNLELWLAPLLIGATGRGDLETLSVSVAIDSYLGYGSRAVLDRLAPTHLVVPSERRVLIDYTAELPTASSRAQDFFGLTDHPRILEGVEPVTIELLSPAGRPIQRTSDIVGFWSGSWAEVRKDMAGRYPKHRWPKDPTSL